MTCSNSQSRAVGLESRSEFHSHASSTEIFSYMERKAIERGSSFGTMRKKLNPPLPQFLHL